MCYIEYFCVVREVLSKRDFNYRTQKRVKLISLHTASNFMRVMIKCPEKNEKMQRFGDYNIMLLGYILS
jgi:hypothetical protein